jgi:hypothetical protein
MRFDFSGAELFQEYVAGRVSAAQVLEHPAYRRVQHHALLFGGGITPHDLDDALRGRPSPFYGLERLPGRMAGIRRLLERLRCEQDVWLQAAESTLAALFPVESLDIPIYPILGYDRGIGLDGAACLNCSHAGYLEAPQEFLFYMIHECVHVIYERSHHVPGLSDIASPAGWRAYFNLWLQNEGYAVYAPLALRRARGGLAEGDYQVLMDPDRLEAHRLTLLEAWKVLQNEASLPPGPYLEICFGPQRLTYRMGCELIRRIERVHGMKVVRQAFYLSGDEFVGMYASLLKRKKIINTKYTKETKGKS